jgi:hypothetical protein
VEGFAALEARAGAGVGVEAGQEQMLAIGGLG